MADTTYTLVAAWLEELGVDARFRPFGVNGEDVEALEFTVPFDEMLVTAQHFNGLARMLIEAYEHRIHPHTSAGRHHKA